MTFNGYTELEDPLTEGQALGLLLVSVLVSLTSMLGSSSIIYFIVRHRRYKGPDSFFRLMLGVSGADIILSSWNLTTNFYFPKEVGFHYTFGNVVTCSLSGFLAYAGGLAGILYNTGLSCNFVAACAGEWSSDKIITRVEYPTHVIGIGLPLVISTVTACLHFFNTSPGIRICALQSEPYNCQNDPDIECVRGRTDSNVSTIETIYYMYLFFMMVGTSVALVNLAVVTVVARRRLQAGMQHHSESMKLKKRIRMLRRRTVLYGFSQINTTIWATVISFRDFDLASQKRLYPFLIVSNAMISIQGALNAIIFFQLRYARVRRLFPEAGISTSLGLMFGAEKAQMTYVQKRRAKEPNNPIVESGTSTQNHEQIPEGPSLSNEEHFYSEHSSEDDLG